MSSGVALPARILVTLLFAFLSVMLAGCGGGGGGDAPARADGGGGGGGGGTPPPPPPPPPPAPACANGSIGGINVQIAQSRLSGVAPLAVFFDATATTGGAGNPFHQLGYRWDFGDPASGVWANGSKPGASQKNIAGGPVAAHVFESAGTFNVCLQVTADGVTIADGGVTVTVSDPDTVFAHPNTICISQSGNFADVPAGFCTTLATQITSGNFATAIATNAAPGRRLLFRAGEVFTTTGAARLQVTGPGIIGSYGASNNGRAILRSTNNSGILIISNGASNQTPYLQDWRLMDLEFDGQGNAFRTAITAEGGFDQLTFLRLHLHDIADGYTFAVQPINGNNTAFQTPHHLYDQLAIVDNTIQRIGGCTDVDTPAGCVLGKGAFLAATRLMFMGNLVDDTTKGEHPVRVQYASRLAFSNNSLRNAPGISPAGPGAPAGSKETLTIRAPNSSAAAAGGASHFPLVFAGGVAVTEKVVVADNEFQIRGYAGAAANEVNNVTDQRMQNVIFERNWYHRVAGAGNTGDAINVRADGVTVRNEIIDMSNFNNGHNAIRIMAAVPTAAGCPPAACMPAATNVNVLNNTIYSADAGPNFIGAIIETGVTNVTIQNNLAYAPAATPTILMIRDDALIAETTCPVDGTGFTCNSAVSQITGANPQWSIASPMTPLTRFTPGVGSYAIDRGVATPTFVDFFGAARAAPHDMGAVNP